MSPFTLKLNGRKQGAGGKKPMWSPTQEILDSPCTRLLKERQTRLRAESLLSRFLEIQLQETGKAPQSPGAHAHARCKSSSCNKENTKRLPEK